MPIIPTSPERGRPRGRAGFTLVELLIALVISGLLVGVIFQLLHGNSRYVQRQSAREEVQQNGRAALDLVVSDLRAVAPGGLVQMEPTSVRFRLPRAWGVLCNFLPRGVAAPAYVLFAPGVFPATEDLWRQPHWGIAVEQTASPAVSTGSWRAVATLSQAAHAAQCAAIKAPLGAGDVAVGFQAAAPFVAAAAPGDALPGTQVLVYEEMRYDVADAGSAGMPGTWLRRMAGYSAAGTPNMQPMAGPVPAEGALRFTYLRADGTETAAPQEVQRIQVRMIVQSRAATEEAGVSRPMQLDTLVSDVYLRN